MYCARVYLWDKESEHRHREPPSHSKSYEIQSE